MRFCFSALGLAAHESCQQPTCPSVSALVQRVLVNGQEEADAEVVRLLQALVGILFRVPYEIHHAALKLVPVHIKKQIPT